MPKSMVISPEEVRRPGSLEIDPIPLNRYQPDIATERERWGDAALVGAYHLGRRYLEERRDQP